MEILTDREANQMKIRELKRIPYFVIEFSPAITFSEEENDVYAGTFTLKELEELIDVAGSFVQDYYRSSKERHDPTNVDTDPPDQYNWNGLEEGREYNVFENEDGHDCKAPVDGG